ncbi:Not1-domain-containing protein [Cryphonectria parasitica EP155]|uniref:General negative regulator of transcription subunit 1 n=1 Tax=Cryphonectria parasitica (strain ATCC 38755 / EP155) TaxID=660469 RepID=A0A9P4XVX9_CRYP1|nr:Not1-domain-containing protein [Cryphonectria parasitica EP155]KAF3761896.1 Not1-domain-containing protein [Cryphonectria parasitica EP155]
MLPRPSGTFSPTPSTGLQTGISHSPHPSQAGVLGAGASPSTSSPTGNYGLSKIAATQVSVLLSTLKTKEDDPVEYENRRKRLNKLLDDHGMEVFTKYFTKLVLASAPQIFPGLNRPTGGAANPGNYSLLQEEMRKISHDANQATKISESIETGTEDIFRDFDLSTFMEHFRLDALEKTILALAFKLGTRPDLKTKADAILSTNFPTFLNFVSQPEGDHQDLSPQFLALIVDRLIQHHPPNFNSASHRELTSRIESRYALLDLPPPSELLAALDLNRLLVDKPSNALVSYIQKVGPDFTRDEETCARFLRDRPSSIPLTEEQVSNALTFTTISQTPQPQHNPSALVAGLQRVLPPGFRWQDVISYFDQPSARISSPQFLRLYRALLLVAQDGASDFDIQRLWGGNWANADAHLSFICAFGSLSPEQLDASTIPGLRPTFTLAEYAQSPPAIREVAEHAARHPLVSVDALSAVFDVALSSVHASQSTEAKRLFNDVVVPNLHIFVVSAFGVPKPWPSLAVETLNSLFDSFLYKRQDGYDFALDSLWRKDKDFVKQKLLETHAIRATDLPLYFEQAVNHGWLDDFIHEFNGFGLDLVAFGHGEGQLDLEQWIRANSARSAELAPALLQFVNIKAKCESEFQRPTQEGHPILRTTPLKVKTVFSFLNVLTGLLPPETPAWIGCQRSCMTAYPRLINYGGEYDDVIDANGKDGNHLPPAATARMEDHYKSMYNEQIEVKDVVGALDSYKHSRNPLDQDIFACMIHGLFDEYMHFISYPTKALATTAVLFGGMISRKLIDGIPLNVGLGMILESFREYAAEENMYRFGLQALSKMYGRLPEWPGFCQQLVQIKSLQGTEAFKEAEAVVSVSVSEEGPARLSNGGLEALTNGNVSEAIEPQFAPFASINVEPPPYGVDFVDPTDDDQDKIQFNLNNIDQSSLRSRFDAIRDSVERKHQQWFAIHLVQERAKMQPNLHQMYLDLVKLFEDNSLWAEIQRATLVCVSQLLNSEGTMHSATERAHLKNLGGWLGMLTLARDKPIRHQNIAFKQLLIEAHDTKRLIVVIPFVCKVLDQGKASTVFRPPNPWLMDIIHLLIELYHNADIKLNQKFEIEVLCKNLNLDHKSIEPSGEILNRVVLEEPAQVPQADGLEAFDNLSLNGIGQRVVSNLLPQVAVPSIPDLGSRLIIPPSNEMVVSSSRLRDIVHTAFNKALQDIIQPVVDRSVTIAAISTQQMIRKDFATEPDENRVRNCAISMVKATAGSLALVTSKEPLRANFTNYMRQLSGDIVGGLPEGTIIMCVNSNLELASGVIEEAAERRAVPEIEEMIEAEVEARRRHRMQRPNQPYVDASLNRWAMTMPDPYKMAPSMGGLNPEQMAIYEEFQRQPHPASTTNTPSHIASTSDATRSMANEVLQDQYSSLPAIPTPAETPSLPSVSGHAPSYSHGHAGLTNGRQPAASGPDLGLLAQRTQKLFQDLQRAATEASEEHYDELPRGHAVLETMDALISVIIKTRNTSEDYITFVMLSMCEALVGPVEDNLVLETFIHALTTLRRMLGPAVSDYAKNFFQRLETPQRFLRLPLIKAFAGTEFLDWRTLDEALARHIRQKDQAGLHLLDEIVKMTILSDVPMALFANLGLSVDAAYAWIMEDHEVPRGDHLKSVLDAVRAQQISTQTREDRIFARQEQMEYVFEEWVNRFRSAQMTDKLVRNFLKQMQDSDVVRSKDDLFLFIRVALDSSVAHVEQAVTAGISIEEAFVFVDALTKLIVEFAKCGEFEDGAVTPIWLIESAWVLATMIVNLHTVKRAELFNQRVFFRFFSDLIFESKAFFEEQGSADWGRALLKMAARLNALGPSLIPGFVYGWMALIYHRAFLPEIMKLGAGPGWDAYTKLLKQLLDFVGESLKHLELSETASKLYETAVKLLIVLEHDYPHYVAANSAAILASIPPHCTQLINTVLMASANKLPDPLEQGSSSMESRDAVPQGPEQAANFLQSMGLLDMLNSALENGPSEDAIAHLTHATTRTEGKTGFGYLTIHANLAVIDALTSYIGHKQAGQQALDPDAPSVLILSMLLLELGPEARYYLILSMVNHLQGVSPDVPFFRELLLHVFAHDLTDPEETEVREQITRALLERLLGYWPQPWGLLSTVAELARNERYMFFDLPFVKANPEVGDKFAQLANGQV